MVNIRLTGQRAAEFLKSTRKLVPLSEYKKPLLKLDSCTKKVIKKAKNSIKRMQYKLNMIDKELSTPWISEADRAALTREKESVMRAISDEQAFIRQNKIEAYENQLNNVKTNTLQVNA